MVVAAEVAAVAAAVAGAVVVAVAPPRVQVLGRAAAQTPQQQGGEATLQATISRKAASMENVMKTQMGRDTATRASPDSTTISEVVHPKGQATATLVQVPTQHPQAAGAR